MAVSAVSAVFRRIGDFQDTSPEMALLKDDLQRLLGFLKDAHKKMMSGNGTIAVLFCQLRDVSYEVENITEAAEYIKKRSMLKKGLIGAISRYACLPCDLVSLHQIDALIHGARRKISCIIQGMLALNIAHLSVAELDNIEDDVHILQSFEEDDAVVGFEDEYREIMDKLLGQESSLSVVSLLAMGGAGKTTLSRKVYSSSTVKQKFEVFVWVTVSQNFKAIDLLNDILKQIREVGGQLGAIDRKEEYKVGKKIHDSLLGKRYLIVFDDMWVTSTWEQMNRLVEVFPDDNNGSRVLLTTRNERVAFHIQLPTHVCHLGLLNEEAGWELFSRKALPRRSQISDLPEFMKLGRKLARECMGLPLALTIVGGCLLHNLNLNAWSDFYGDLRSTKDGYMMINILVHSYNDISDDCLRSCFLYLASFPEDYSIRVSDLIELWIAECLIPHTRRHTLEETARRYVNELVERNLIQIDGQSKRHGCHAYVRINDIVREWCIEEARRDGFLDVIDQTAGRVGASSSSDTMTSGRYCFHDLCDDQILPATPNLRTLVGFRLSPLSLPMFTCLRVLHVEKSDVTIRNLSRFFRGCIHLRCLRLRECTYIMLPSSIRQLLYLQTIDLRGTLLNSSLPNSVWAISTLRHVYLEGVKGDLMLILEKLPCLVVLHLKYYRQLVHTISCSVHGFAELQELALHGPYLTEWKIGHGAMPKLSHLALSFWGMKMLPEALRSLPSLKELELVNMHMIAEDDVTWKALEDRQCKLVKRRC